MKYPNMYEEPEETKITLCLSDEQQAIVDSANEAVKSAMQVLADDPQVCFGASLIGKAAMSVASLMIQSNIQVHYPGVVCDLNGNDLYVEEWLGVMPKGQPLS